MSNFIVHHLLFLNFIPLFLLSIIITAITNVVVNIIVLISVVVISIIFYFLSLLNCPFTTHEVYLFFLILLPAPGKGGLE